AACGAGPCAHRTSGSPRDAGQRIAGRSPPGPFRCGSTTCNVKPAATAASNALPPCSSTAIPAADASQCVDATMPKVPRSSGRVVNTPADDIGLLGEGERLLVDERPLARDGDADAPPETEHAHLDDQGPAAVGGLAGDCDRVHVAVITNAGGERNVAELD